MPQHMPPKYSYAVLAAGIVLFGGAQIYLGGTDPLLLLLLSPFAVFSLAALVAKRNLIVRFAVVLGGLFLIIDLVALVSIVGAKGTSAIGLAVAVLLQLVVAVLLLLAGLIAGRLPWGQKTDGIV